MMIMYDSLTGNVKRFVGKVGMSGIQIDENMIVERPFILVTYTTGFGQISDTTQSFLEKNSNLMLGVAASGNKIWGSNFGRAGRLIAAQYGVPLIHTFELSGTVEDVGLFIREVEQIVQSNSRVDCIQQRDHDSKGWPISV